MTTDPLDHRVPADASSVGRAREEFSRWLHGFDLDESRRCDMVLAVNEALANTAEFAYRNQERPGAVTVRAWHDALAATLNVTISDQGAWREPEAGANPQLRGRGIPLMRALADETTIDSSAAGTTVNLRFDGIGGIGGQDAALL